MCHTVGTRKSDNCSMKICSRCKEKKPLDAFYRKAGRRAASYCKPCQHAYVREHYRRTKAVYNARRYVLAEIYKERNRRLVFAHLAENPCVDCAERDILVLDFDHVQGAKLSSVSRMINDCVSVGKLRAEIEKCEVRCANCHRRKTAFERNSYRTKPWLYLSEAAAHEGVMPLKLWDGRGSNPEPIA
jgi:hypothetical protein